MDNCTNEIFLRAQVVSPQFSNDSQLFFIFNKDLIGFYLDTENQNVLKMNSWTKMYLNCEITRFPVIIDVL